MSASFAWAVLHEPGNIDPQDCHACSELIDETEPTVEALFLFPESPVIPAEGVIRYWHEDCYQSECAGEGEDTCPTPSTT